jgi:hypothetical protein
VDDREKLEDRTQLHIVMPYKLEARNHPRIRSYLDRGYRIVQLQRISDREAIVTLALDAR